MDNALIQHARDFLSAGGSATRALLKSGMNTNALRTNDLLRKQEWELLDTELVGIARQRLIGINDLRAAGLVVNLGGLGITLSQYEKLGDMSSADVDFAGVVDGEKDKVTFTLASVPIPIIHKDFSINIRQMAASTGPSSIGPGIDTTTLDVAAKKVVEQMEELLFNGYTGGGVGGNLLYGYTTEPNINTSSGSDWGTAANPQTDIIAAIDKCEQDNYFGPYTTYVSKTQFGQLRSFFTDGSGDQIFDRLKRIQGLKDMRPGDRLADGSAVLVSMEKSVVDLAVGQDLTVVEWETKGGMQFHFKIMVALSARIKSDSSNGSGINKITGI